MFTSVAPIVNFILRSSEERRKEEEERIAHNKKVNARYVAECKIIEELKQKAYKPLPITYPATKLQQCGTLAFAVVGEATIDTKPQELKMIIVPEFIEYKDVAFTGEEALSIKSRTNNQKTKAYKQLMKALEVN